MWLRMKENGENLLFRPKYFDSEEEMLAWVNHPDYMQVSRRKGLCFAITYKFEEAERERSWDEPKWKEHKFKFHFDDQE